jgi:hypothetical protein
MDTDIVMRKMHLPCSLGILTVRSKLLNALQTSPVGNTIGKNDDEGKRITQITLRNQTQQALQSIARFTGQLLHPTTTSSKQSQRVAVVGELEALADEYVC